MKKSLSWIVTSPQHRPIHSLQKLCPLVDIFGENPIDFSQ